jgi:hypothetical protein
VADEPKLWIGRRGVRKPAQVRDVLLRVLRACEKRLTFSSFPMFVPSLSW